MQDIIKITYHAKDRENLNLNEKRQSANDNTKMTQMLELSNKGFKALIIKMFQQAIMNTHETNEKTESLNKEIADKIQ